MYTDLVMNLGPVPLVPWGTTRYEDKIYTMRKLLSMPTRALGVGVATSSTIITMLKSSGLSPQQGCGPVPFVDGNSSESSK